MNPGVLHVPLRSALASASFINLYTHTLAQSDFVLCEILLCILLSLVWYGLFSRYWDREHSQSQNDNAFHLNSKTYLKQRVALHCFYHTECLKLRPRNPALTSQLGRNNLHSTFHAAVRISSLSHDEDPQRETLSGAFLTVSFHN